MFDASNGVQMQPVGCECCACSRCGVPYVAPHAVLKNSHSGMNRLCLCRCVFERRLVLPGLPIAGHPMFMSLQDGDSGGHSSHGSNFDDASSSLAPALATSLFRRSRPDFVDLAIVRARVQLVKLRAGHARPASSAFYQALPPIHAQAWKILD